MAMEATFCAADVGKCECFVKDNLVCQQSKRFNVNLLVLGGFVADTDWLYLFPTDS